MDTVIITGRVHPAGYIINGEHNGMRYNTESGSLSGRVDIKISASAITVRWTLDHKYDVSLLHDIWSTSRRLAAAIVNLIAFRQGRAAIVILDRYTAPGVTSEALSLDEPAVAGLATSLPENDDRALLNVFSIMANEQQLLLVLEDLIAALASQEHKNINCARCVEAVRQLIAGYDLATDQQWPIMREKLNLERSYLDFIMSNSTNHRHGKQVPVESAVVVEIMKRTWTIIDRFFHYRLGGNQKLDETRFPVLTGP